VHESFLRRTIETTASAAKALRLPENPTVSFVRSGGVFDPRHLAFTSNQDGNPLPVALADRRFDAKTALPPGALFHQQMAFACVPVQEFSRLRPANPLRRGLMRFYFYPPRRVYLGHFCFFLPCGPVTAKVQL